MKGLLELSCWGLWKKGKAEYLVFVWVGGVEADVYPVVLNVDAFGFESDWVEVDCAFFLTRGKVDDVEPVVAGAVSVGEVGVAVFYFTALSDVDAVDGYGL